jgi:hypothetical protein
MGSYAPIALDAKIDLFLALLAILKMACEKTVLLTAYLNTFLDDKKAIRSSGLHFETHPKKQLHY